VTQTTSFTSTVSPTSTISVTQTTSFTSTVSPTVTARRFKEPPVFLVRETPNSSKGFRVEYVNLKKQPPEEGAEPKAS
jgi:hypothetical protein